ncbi:putative endopeptidase [Solimonas aquatica]|uniref:Putative endopeptidase n=1 Tax=Solimonas aquatica TaxID=489703 RepID=A0A1H9F8N7_9GAMM|nr:M13-type metalloendopeptidase [Solimonas aquatica]SEQ34312.1 putative endopeptidase [Solimonas aquatica]
MPNLPLRAAGACLALTLLAACHKDKAPPPPAAAPAAVSGVEKGNFDDKVRAQDDFYRHINGHWLDNTPVPADKSNYGAFTKLADDAELHLRELIETAAASKDKKPGSDEQKVGDLYASFMDEARANELGLKPLQAELANIDALQDKKNLAALLAHLSRLGVDVFQGAVQPDAKAPTQYIVYLEQGGTLLPDRDYYLLDDAKFKSIRAAYRSHIENMLKLAGIADAGKNAEAILALETALAKAQWTKVDTRDADKTYNKYPFAELAKLTPGFDWNAYIEGVNVQKSPGLIIGEPSFFTAWDQLMQKTPLPTLKVYLKWQLLSAYAPYLSKDFVDENFAFFGKTLNGTQELKPRWKRAVDTTENALGEVLGRLYVAKYFPPEAKARMETLVQNLLAAYKQSISTLDWMGEETRAKALEKLAKFSPKIGYPTKWKDYSALEVKADDLVGNVMRSAAVEHARAIDKLGGPIDREEWEMTPQTVNAYYNPLKNEIVFPAAILQPPFFDLNADDAVNYGGIGAVIGHEIGHGFDDQGSKFDGDGNLKSWWTEQDRKNFEARTKALIAQYDAYQPLPGQHLSGAFTIGENIGDLGGLSIAYKAYQLALGGKPAPVLDGFTGDQRFFIGWAQVWRRNYREENLLARLKSDPHSPSEFRCNGVVINVPAFYTAFDVKDSDKMYLAPEKRVKIW